jgi:CheY-like chemotaxis protein
MLPSVSRHKRVLIVDDNVMTRETLSMLLAGDGYMVSVAANGQEAMERLRGLGRPDLILLDLVMPIKDGVEFCKERQLDPELATIPLIVFSGAEDGEKQAAHIGAAAYIHKPVEPEELLQTLHKCC